MFHRLALTLTLVLTSAAATAEPARPLDAALRAYVEAFDLGAVPDHARERLRTIVSHDTASHTAKVVAIHDILLRHGALRHVDMHGAPPLHLSALH